MQRVLPLLLSTFLVSPLVAHDYWLAPADYRPAVGQQVDVRMFVGHEFGDLKERSLQLSRTVRFRLLNSRGQSVNLLRSETDGQKPLVQLRLADPGTHLLSLQRDWSMIEMEAEKFHGYLEHEGLTDAIEQREQAGEADQTASERYRRYLKSLILADGVATDTWQQRLGHRLEIIPQSDPSAVKPGNTLPVQVLFESRPLANVQVMAMGRNGDDVTIHSQRTDAEGRAQFTLDHPGEWIVRLVYLRRCPRPKKADWESFWSAMTFEVVGGNQDGTN